MPFYSPLRYPGGKRKLANFFKVVIQENDLCDAHYVEPYAGGAAVALELLFEEYVSHIHINDLDPAIYAFWYAALNDTEALCDRLRQTDVTIAEWHRQKEIHEHGADASQLELGFSALFLNRTNRSGIIGGGVIGGQDQRGRYKLDARFNKDDIARRIRRVGRYRGRISLTAYDGADLVSQHLDTVPGDCLVYLDPPYYVKGRGLYQSYYEHDDHIRVANTIVGSGRRWIVTYDNVSEIRAMYEGYPALAYDLHYSAAQRYRGAEIMFVSPDLWTPDVDSPVGINLHEAFCA